MPRAASRVVAHHRLGEESRRFTRVAAEELDHEEGHAQGAVALDALDDPLGRAPDAVFLEGAAHVAAVDLLGLLEPRTARGVVFADHDDAGGFLDQSRGKLAFVEQDGLEWREDTKLGDALANTYKYMGHAKFSGQDFGMFGAETTCQSTVDAVKLANVVPSQEGGNVDAILKQSQNLTAKIDPKLKGTVRQNLAGQVTKIATDVYRLALQPTSEAASARVIQV